MNVRRILLFLPVVLAVLLGLFLWKGLSMDPRELPSALIGKPFPEFQLASLQNDGRQLTRDDLIGRPALVNVWATWCPACKVEHPQLMSIARRDGVPIYGINYKDDRAAAQTWLRQYQNPYQFNIYDDEGKLGFDLGVYGAPETYIIDAKGVIRYRLAGPIDIKTWEEMRAMIRELEAES
ncbi:DsbE family thiol:disulfide interchange protein [Motiliproteus sediminis]|uniref:DsbE family thiol:disulfide interchange protein n=1 Tax=Motiliproteus sediminis TaxID=1468178 RepID=UPI001AEF9186|nr:DsbE family thiol:disulfide interchange protein [Motiliproteus sediminis]